jgi:hypothetical protein
MLRTVGKTPDRTAEAHRRLRKDLGGDRALLAPGKPPTATQWDSREGQAPTLNQVKNILLRARKDPFEVMSAEDTLSRNKIANNSGNHLLRGGLQDPATRGTTVTADGLHTEPDSAAEINERYDAYVFPLANAFRPSYQRKLTARPS